ncbi:diguanylate cyclase domain-containing protein [Endothiovibrio diazotrophicus]
MSERSPRPPLAVGFVTVIALLVAMVAFGLSRMAQITASLEKVVNEYNVQGSLALEMRRNSRERSLLLHSMAITDDPFERDDLFLELRRLGGQFLEAREQLLAMDLSERERTLLDHQRDLSAVAGPLQYQVIDLLNDERFDEANRLLLQQAIPAQERALRVIDSFVALQQEHNREALEVTVAEFRQAHRWMLILGGLTVLLSAVVAAYVMRRVGRMMAALTTANLRLGGVNDELQRTRDLLEQRVAERTEALYRANEQLREEVEERRQAENRLERLANYDPITDLPNRTLFTEHLKLALAQGRRRQLRVGLLLADLDGFKQVNDTLGHDAGNQLLRAAGERLRQRLRDEDMAARIGDDEFTVILGELNATADAGVVAQKVVDAFAAPFHLNGHTRRVGVSIGIALYPDDSSDLDTLIRYAEDAMGEVKRMGRNHYRFHGPATAEVGN